MVFVNKLVLIIDCMFFFYEWWYCIVINGGNIIVSVICNKWVILFKCLRLERGILNKNMKEDFCECLFFYR